MLKIAINGFGRIGRLTFRNLLKNSNIEVVAINDLTGASILAHLLEFDSIFGRLDSTVTNTENKIIVDGKEIKIFSEKDPVNLPWGDLGVDVVIESTGAFRTSELAGKHIQAGAKKVVISAPAKSDDINSYLLGINADKYQGEQIVDMGSCTTNCLAPLAKVLHESFGIVSGYMTTIHSYTNDQKILDLPHSDLRRSRAAGLNIIPTTTGATKAIGKVIPELQGKLKGIAYRVPTATVSLVELTCEVEKEVSVEEINNKLEELSKKIPNIFSIEEKPLVSSDFKGNPHSSILDKSLTEVNGRLVKICAWYDNEWGYSTRLAEFAEFIGNN